MTSTETAANVRVDAEHLSTYSSLSKTNLVIRSQVLSLPDLFATIPSPSLQSSPNGFFRIDQFQANIDEIRLWLEATDVALSTLGSTFECSEDLEGVMELEVSIARFTPRIERLRDQVHHVCSGDSSGAFMATFAELQKSSQDLLAHWERIKRELTNIRESVEQCRVFHSETDKMTRELDTEVMKVLDGGVVSAAALVGYEKRLTEIEGRWKVRNLPSDVRVREMIQGRWRSIKNSLSKVRDANNRKQDTFTAVAAQLSSLLDNLNSVAEKSLCVLRKGSSSELKTLYSELQAKRKHYIPAITKLLQLLSNNIMKEKNSADDSWNDMGRYVDIEQRWERIQELIWEVDAEKHKLEEKLEEGEDENGVVEFPQLRVIAPSPIRSLSPADETKKEENPLIKTKLPMPNNNPPMNAGYRPSSPMNAGYRPSPPMNAGYRPSSPMNVGYRPPSPMNGPINYQKNGGYLMMQRSAIPVPVEQSMNMRAPSPVGRQTGMRRPVTPISMAQQRPRSPMSSLPVAKEKNGRASPNLSANKGTSRPPSRNAAPRAVSPSPKSFQKEAKSTEPPKRVVSSVGDLSTRGTAASRAKAMAATQKRQQAKPTRTAELRKQPERNNSINKAPVKKTKERNIQSPTQNPTTMKEKKQAVVKAARSTNRQSPHVVYVDDYYQYQDGYGNNNFIEEGYYEDDLNYYMEQDGYYQEHPIYTDYPSMTMDGYPLYDQRVYIGDDGYYYYEQPQYQNAPMSRLPRPAHNSSGTARRAMPSSRPGSSMAMGVSGRTSASNLAPRPLSSMARYQLTPRATPTPTRQMYASRPGSRVGSEDSGVQSIGSNLNPNRTYTGQAQIRKVTSNQNFRSQTPVGTSRHDDSPSYSPDGFVRAGRRVSVGVSPLNSAGLNSTFADTVSDDDEDSAFPKYIPDPTDELDEKLAQIVNKSPLNVAVRRVGKGRYAFGGKVWFCKLNEAGSKNGGVMVRVGGGWTDLDRVLLESAIGESK